MTHFNLSGERKTTKERRARLAREIDEEDELERLELEKAKRGAGNKAREGEAG